MRDILQRQPVAPAPERAKQGGRWRTLLNHEGQHMRAGACFTVETAWLTTLQALFFLERGRRRVHFAGGTAHPTVEWVAQPARPLTWTLHEEQLSRRFLIHDRDAKFPTRGDRVFAAEGLAIVRTPYRTPIAKAVAARGVRAVREDCLDQRWIVNEAHL